MYLPAEANYYEANLNEGPSWNNYNNRIKHLKRLQREKEISNRNS